MWDSSNTSKASKLHTWAPCLQFHGSRAGTLRFVQGALVRSTCIPSSSPDWLVRATSSLFEHGDTLAPAHHLWATTSGPVLEEVGARISRWGHTCTHSTAETGAVGKGSDGPHPSCISRPDTTSQSAHAPSAAPCSPPVGPPSNAASP